MRSKLGQKFIDKIRGKKKIYSSADFMRRIKKSMISKKFIFNENKTILTPDGILFNEDSSTYEIYEVFVNKDYEVFCDKQHQVYIDVGMNMAASTLYFANLKNTDFVYAYEPFTPTCNKGQANINLNQIKDKIKVFNFGLGNKNENLDIEYNPEQSGCMSTTFDVFKLNSDICKKATSTEKIEIKKASEALLPILSKHKDSPIILKVDTEGAEYDIFEDLDSLNMLNKFDVVMLEYHFKSPQELEDKLTKNGFVVWYKGEHKVNEKTGMLFAVNTLKK